jgi:hypothetical protein
MVVLWSDILKHTFLCFAAFPSYVMHTSEPPLLFFFCTILIKFDNKDYAIK